MFSCLGYAIAGMIGSPDAAQPVVQITMLPLYFISGVFVPSASLSPTLRHIAEVFPVEHLAAAMHLASVRGSFTSALAPKDLAVLAVWAIAAGLFAARRFSWLPAAATG
jgi:ABC-2 type transport system permease protein